MPYRTLVAVLAAQVLTWALPASATGRASRPRTPLPSAASPSRLAEGAAHTCARFKHGDLLCWGSNTHGQLGTGDTQHRGETPNDLEGPPVNLLGRAPIQVAAGAAHTCALLVERRLHHRAGCAHLQHRAAELHRLVPPWRQPGAGEPIAVDLCAGGLRACLRARWAGDAPLAGE
jgi:hypothetical protein